VLEWRATKEDVRLIVAIMDRVQQAKEEIRRDVVSMDLEAVHSNGCPLDFARMAKGKISDIMHDIRGIAKHIDRMTGKLKGGFTPRFIA